ncbi:MAG: cell division protein SepF [Clostridia bacterium]|nr:cell division protein SepF [Clostridia bacterium]
MSYIKMLKNGEVRPKKVKKHHMTSYDRYMASKRPSTLVSNGNTVVLHPKTAYDVQQIIVSLRHKKGAVINLQNISSVNAQRLLDYLCGAIFALDAKIEKLDDFKYLVMPNGVEIGVSKI